MTAATDTSSTASPTHDHPALAPVRLGTLDLANRLAVAPMTRVSAADDGTPTTAMADYYETFAAGGFGLVITEGTYTDAAYSQGYLRQPGLVTDGHVRGWRTAVDRVHAAGARIVAQLMHAGALSQGNPYRSSTIAPSRVRPLGAMMPEYGGQGSWPVPREMDASDIDQAVRGFVAAARNAHRAGFDGVEIHGANGYLLDQFLTTYTNQRNDRYGGPVANRLRLAAEVVRAVRAATAPGFCVGVRLSQTKVNDFEYRWSGGVREAETIFAALADAGASYLHVASEGRNWIETARLSGGTTITGVARRVSGLPVLANGGMHDPDQGAQVLADGHADLLTLARGALANPDYPTRLASSDAVRPVRPRHAGPGRDARERRPVEGPAGGEGGDGGTLGRRVRTVSDRLLPPPGRREQTAVKEGMHAGQLARRRARRLHVTFDVDAETPILAAGRRYARHASTMSHQAYGPDVGVPRLLDLLDELGVPATFFVPGWVAEHRPALAPSIVARGHEVAHHSYAHRPATSMTPEDERADFERALAVFADQSVPIAGHRAALWEASWHTIDLVAEYGLTYDSSLMGDDRPYLVPRRRPATPARRVRSSNCRSTGPSTTGSSTRTCPTPGSAR